MNRSTVAAIAAASYLAGALITDHFQSKLVVPRAKEIFADGYARGLVVERINHGHYKSEAEAFEDVEFEKIALLSAI